MKILCQLIQLTFWLMVYGVRVVVYWRIVFTFHLVIIGAGVHHFEPLRGQIPFGWQLIVGGIGEYQIEIFAYSI